MTSSIHGYWSTRLLEKRGDWESVCLQEKITSRELWLRIKKENDGVRLPELFRSLDYIRKIKTYYERTPLSEFSLTIPECKDIIHTLLFAHTCGLANDSNPFTNKLALDKVVAHKRHTSKRSKKGKALDLGLDYLFRSSWERNFARYLEYLRGQNKIKKWEYEVDKFIFSSKIGIKSSYLPDFKIYQGNKVYYVEVKGYMDAISARKLKNMKRFYPKVEVQVLGKKEYQKISKVFRSKIKNWES